MGRISIKLDSAAIDAVVKQLDAVGDLPERAPAALMAGAQVIHNAVLPATPVRSGELKTHIAIRKRGSGAYASVEVGAINAPVAHLVEEGHGGPKPAPAHPFLEPAAQSVEDVAMAAIADELMGGL